MRKLFWRITEEMCAAYGDLETAQYCLLRGSGLSRQEAESRLSDSK